MYKRQALERDRKKYNIQLKQMKDTEKKDKYKVYGEILTAYGYSIEPGTKKFETENFYTGETITIPLDETLSPIDNAKKFYDKSVSYTHLDVYKRQSFNHSYVRFSNVFF